MAPKFKVGETVFVPAAHLGEGADRSAYALVGRDVLAQTNRSVTVDNYRREGTIKVASSLVHSRNLGFLVLRVGDMATETTLLDPLANSVLQFLRLLVPDNDLRLLNVRTMAELLHHWKKYSHGTSHVILIGHGDLGGIEFIDAGLVSGATLGKQLDALTPKASAKCFVSLACLSGRSEFAKAFSQSRICGDLVAPFGSVHGATASQFCQGLLSFHLLLGIGLPAAHRRADQLLGTGQTFRRWRNGKLVQHG